MDFSNFLIDGLLEFKRVESFKDFFQLVFSFSGNGLRFQDSLIGSLGLIVMFDDLGSDTFFRQEFHGRDKEVVVEAPILFIEVVEERDNERIFESSVA